MGHSQKYLEETARIAGALDPRQIERIAIELAALRDRAGRLFLIGVGGGAANCSHAVNDFRKLCGIEAYTPVDNVSELTARTNDDGWDTVFAEWLKTSHASARDAIMVFSVGGGDAERNISANIVAALDLALERGLKIFGVVGRETGHAKTVGDEVIVVPAPNPERLTAHTEAFQAVIWHCLVCHPALQQRPMTWEKQMQAAEPDAAQ